MSALSPLEKFMWTPMERALGALSIGVPTKVFGLLLYAILLELQQVEANQNVSQINYD